MSTAISTNSEAMRTGSAYARTLADPDHLKNQLQVPWEAILEMTVLEAFWFSQQLTRWGYTHTGDSRIGIWFARK